MKNKCIFMLEPLEKTMVEYCPLLIGIQANFNYTQVAKFRPTMLWFFFKNLCIRFDNELGSNFDFV